MNRCYVCEAEAVGRCFTCGRLFCAEHGRENCQTCDGAVMAGDPRPDHVSAVPLRPRDAGHAWWRPQPAEEFVPPACYACGGLSRRVCQHCHSRYCPEHAGPGRLCADCGRSARLGLIVFVAAISLLLGLILLGSILP